ncbi:hypothetical protein ACQKWADRAFT_197356 [Trichoderma austrokoningii]
MRPLADPAKPKCTRGKQALSVITRATALTIEYVGRYFQRGGAPDIERRTGTCDSLCAPSRVVVLHSVSQPWPGDLLADSWLMMNLQGRLQLLMGFADGEGPRLALRMSEKAQGISRLFSDFSLNLPSAESTREVWYCEEFSIVATARHVAERTPPAGYWPGQWQFTSIVIREPGTLGNDKQRMLQGEKHQGKNKTAWGLEKKNHQQKKVDKVDSGHNISPLTPRISVAATNAGGALWCHRSHMCQNTVDAS